MSDLSIAHLRKTFGAAVALDDVTITARDGEFLTLLGPSGCGKSTTLWSIAGLHDPDAGTIRAGDDVLFDAASGVNRPAEDRNCGVVFQSYAVWPHMSVADNVGYPLKLRRVKGPARRARVAEMLALVELGPYADRYPHELSGGQQQRVALARALAYEPRLLLLDEPFSNLDAKLRERARDWLRALQRRVGVTTVFVTHDQDEALSMSDRVVVMDGGSVLQVGTPEDIYMRPETLFVADFVGGANVLAGELVAGDGRMATVRLPGAGAPLQVASALRDPGPVDLVVRPESLVLEPDAGDGIEARVLDRAYLGDHYRYRVAVGDAAIGVTTRRADLGDRLRIVIPPGEARLFERTQTSSKEQQ